MSSTKPTQTACADRLRRILLHGDLSAGLGLPEGGCRLADVEAVLGTDGTKGRGELSRLYRRWVKYTIPGGDTETRVWLGEREEVLLIEVDEPPIQEAPEALRRRLGEPAGIIPARVSPTHQEWIYPSRGITVAVGKHGDLEDAPDRITYLFLYAPTTLERYVEELGGKEEWVRRFPRRD